MATKYNRKLILESGEEYFGYGFGGTCDKVCEVVFNTSMVGYQELISDPAYAFQIVVMTYPLIGNYGMTDEDYETKVPSIGGLIVRDYNDMPSNFRFTKTLSEVMEENNIPGISGLDTRKLFRSLRNKDVHKALICGIDTTVEEGLKCLSDFEMPASPVSKVSCKKRWYSRTSNHRFNVAAIDCGIKLSAIRALNSYGCNVTILPYNTSAEEIAFMNPDGLFISSGPGNPKDVPEVIELVKTMNGKLPIFGIGLGHQIISLAYGADTYKMKLGHHGSNHPIKNIDTGKVEIALQNHSYAVDTDSIANTGLKITHIDLLDNTVEGVECKENKVFAVQYQAETSSGPQASGYLFDKFISAMEAE